MAEKRLRFSPSGEKIIYELKKSYNDGTTHLIFTPMQFIEKLAALVPRPRIHLTRFHGCLAPNARIRKTIVPKANPKEAAVIKAQEKNSKRIGWARHLKRIFDIDLEKCSACGGEMKVIAAIMKREAVTKILDHLNLNSKPPTIFPARTVQQGFNFEF